MKQELLEALDLTSNVMLLPKNILREYDGDMRSAAMISQCLYWWRKMEQEPFWKHVGPVEGCETESWAEELCCSPNSVRNTLKKIGYKLSPGEVLPDDCDKPIIYWTDLANRTWFEIHADNLLSLLEKGVSGKEKKSKPAKESKSRITQNKEKEPKNNTGNPTNKEDADCSPPQKLVNLLCNSVKSTRAPSTKNSWVIKLSKFMQDHGHSYETVKETLLYAMEKNGTAGFPIIVTIPALIRKWDYVRMYMENGTADNSKQTPKLSQKEQLEDKVNNHSNIELNTEQRFCLDKYFLNKSGYSAFPTMDNLLPIALSLREKNYLVKMFMKWFELEAPDPVKCCDRDKLFKRFEGYLYWVAENKGWMDKMTLRHLLPESEQIFYEWLKHLQNRTNKKWIPKD